MEEILMTQEEIREEIKFEDNFGVNTLLQNVINRMDKVNVFKKINERNERCGYAIRDKITGKNVQY